MGDLRDSLWTNDTGSKLVKKKWTKVLTKTNATTYRDVGDTGDVGDMGERSWRKSEFWMKTIISRFIVRAGKRTLEGLPACTENRDES